jgi:hypothetical protein
LIADLISESAHLFRAVAPVLGIVKMGLVGHARLRQQPNHHQRPSLISCFASVSSAILSIIFLVFSSVITSATARASIASQEENEWPREGHTNPFAQPERTGIVRVHQKSQDQSGAKVEPSRRTTAPDRRAQA